MSLSRSWTLSCLMMCMGTSVASAGDWTSWRGPAQDGTSDETGLVARLSAEGDNLLWSVDLPSRATPVVHNGTAYIFGYRGEGPALEEVLVALDVATGAIRWERRFRDFLSDIIYDRYSVGAPVVDPATGNIFVQSSAGVLMGWSPQGEALWEVSMMEAFGRLTFPNGRTGGPVVDGDRVIVHGITANWGAEGPARDRFYAFDKRTGALLWSSTPGVGPKDSSYSTPLFEDRGGRRVMYSGTGCGNVVAMDARTGEPLWRFQMSIGGVNVSLVRDGDVLVAAHAVENLDSTTTGRMVGLDLTAPTTPPTDGPSPELQGELWRADIVGFSSSPVLHDGIVYQVAQTGELHALDVKTGEELWQVKLGADQLHASPAYADGRLFVPMWDGKLHIVQAGRDGGRILHTTKLQGAALGAPAISDGRILVTTTDKVYAFGAHKPTPTRTTLAPEPKPGEGVALRVVPAELLLRPGERVPLTAQVLDAQGVVVREVPVTQAERFIPPTAKVKAEMDATFDKGAIVAAPDASLSAGAWKVTMDGLSGTTRGRTVVGVPYAEDFEAYALDVDSAEGPFAWPPLAWIGARFKWEVRELQGSKVLAKTLDRMLFQRATAFLGHPDEHDYTLTADVLMDGDRRMVSSAGLVNQRYLIALKANQRVLEVSSNQERLKQSVPFAAKPGVWYRLKTQVVPGEGDVRIVRAKAWPRDEAEPDAWTIEVAHPNGHTHGAPGLFGFSPRNLHRVYIDQVAITPVEESP